MELNILGAYNIIFSYTMKIHIHLGLGRTYPDLTSSFVAMHNKSVSVAQLNHYFGHATI